MPAQAVVLAPRTLALRRGIAVVLGAALVAAAAQVSVPLPNTPVPLTLQPLAVLVVGGLLGPGLGATSLLLYLALGAAGIPVFTPIGLPGLARLVGPTGGYLLSYPIAAYAVGGLLGDGARLARNALAALAGMALIHLGGVAQLALLPPHNLAVAAQLGSLPFLVADLIKVGIAALVLKPTTPTVRTRL